MHAQVHSRVLAIWLPIFAVKVLVAALPAEGVDRPGGASPPGGDASLWYEHVLTLAGPAFEGRAPGTRGIELAAEYVESCLRSDGLRPAFPDRGPVGVGAVGKSYRQFVTIPGIRPGAPAVTTANLAGILPGRGCLQDQYLVIGGHYDHLGRSQEGTKSHGEAEMLLGADDNASGTAAVLMLAQRLEAAYREASDSPDLRSIIFVAFTAEERGQLGSLYFVRNPPVPPGKISAMINLDMVGHLRESLLSLSGYGTAVQFPVLLGVILKESGLSVITQPGTGASDQMSFLSVGIPVLYAMTGGHEEIHQPADLPATLDSEGAVKVIDLVERIARRLAANPGTLTFAAQADIGGSICSTLRRTDPGAEGAVSADGGRAALPDTPAGRCVAAYLEAFNSGGDGQVEDFEKQYRAASVFKNRSLEDRVSQINQIRDDLGRLNYLKVVSASPAEMSVLALSSKSGEPWTLTFAFEDQPPHGLVTLRIMPSSSPGDAAVYTQPIDEALRKDTVRKIAALLRDAYVDPEIGRRMADALERHEAEGLYGSVSSAVDLALRLTSDLLAVYYDKHLMIVPFSGPNPPMGCAATSAAQDNYGFRKTDLLPGKIGYIRFDIFLGSDEARQAAAAALASVVGCDALIFDVRDNMGGSPRMVEFLASYLFDKPTHLDDFYDRLNNKAMEIWTLATVPGKRFPNDLPVYILTSELTASAAEGFAYDLKYLGRAVIVGAKTSGAAHKVTDEVVNDRFLVHLPYQREVNPVTKGNWEGVGVEPDISVSAPQALDAARKDAAMKLSARGKAAAPSSRKARGRW